MRNKKWLALIAAAAVGAVMLLPDSASARVAGFGGGFRGGGFGVGGFRGVGIGGWRGAGLGWRGAGWGLRPGWGGWGWRRPGWGWGAAALGAGLIAGSHYGGYPYDYGYAGYGGCVLTPRLV